MANLCSLLSIFLFFFVVANAKVTAATDIVPYASAKAEKNSQKNDETPETTLVSNSKRPVLLRIYDLSKCKGALQYMNNHSMGLSECVDPGALKQAIATWKSLKGFFAKTPNCEPYKKVLCYGDEHQVQENTLIIASKELAWVSLANPAPAIFHLSFTESGGKFYLKTIKSEKARGICGKAGDLGLFLSALESDAPKKLDKKDCLKDQKRVEREMASTSRTEPGV